MQIGKVEEIKEIEQISQIKNNGEIKDIPTNEQKLLNIEDSDADDKIKVIDENSVEPSTEVFVAKTSSQKTSATNKKNTTSKIQELNYKEYEETVLNSKGTVYVEFGREICGRCDIWKNAVISDFDEINQYAQVYSMNCDDNNKLYWELAKQTGGSPGILPMIIKFVDGKVAEQIQIPFNLGKKAITNGLISSAKQSAQENKEQINSENNTNSKDLSTQKTTETEKLNEIETELKEIAKEKREKDIEYYRLKAKIKNQEAYYKELTDRISRASNDDNVEELQEEASALSNFIIELNSHLEKMESNIASLKNKYSSKKSEKTLQTQIIERIDEQISINPKNENS